MYLRDAGSMRRKMGDLMAARPYLEEALDICKKRLGMNHPNTALCLVGMGDLLLEMRHYSEARTYFEQALSINQTVLGSEHPITAESLDRLGTMFATAGKESDAWMRLAKSATIYARLADRLLTSSAEREHTGIIVQRRSLYEKLLNLAEKSSDIAENERAELLAAILDWKGISARALVARQETLLLGKDPEARTLHERLNIARHQLIQTLFQGPGMAPVEKYQKVLDQRRDQVDELERQLGRHAQGFAVVLRTQQADLKDVARRLSIDSILVEFVRFDAFDFHAKPGHAWGSARYAAITLQPSPGSAAPVIRFVAMGEAKPIDAALREWRAAAQSGAISPTTDRTLRERIWEPLAKALPEGTKRLLVSPDGELSLLPFEAIRLSDGQYLVEKYQISYLSNGRDLMPRPVPQEKPGRPVVVANPDYDVLAEEPSTSPPPTLLASTQNRSGEVAKRGLRFQSLPGFRREADAVSKAWRVARPQEPLDSLRGSAATEEKLAEIKRPRLLYLITHGFFLPDLEWLQGQRNDRGLELVSLSSGGPSFPAFRENPLLRSGLALAGANRWKERSDRGLSDGLLTAYEIQNLDLWGTELVVLSACETGLGEVSNIGEGVLGLRRAFQNAGSRTVIASLWKVPDQETERLMTRFFELWLNGKPKAEALRAAELDMIQELRLDKDEMRHTAPPLLWAGFICHGHAE